MADPSHPTPQSVAIFSSQEGQTAGFPHSSHSQSAEPLFWVGRREEWSSFSYPVSTHKVKALSQVLRARNPGPRSVTEWRFHAWRDKLRRPGLMFQSPRPVLRMRLLHWKSGSSPSAPVQWQRGSSRSKGKIDGTKPPRLFLRGWMDIIWISVGNTCQRMLLRTMETLVD